MENITQPANEISEMNQSTDTTISNIKNLQEMERNLYAGIENAASLSNPPSLEEQEQVINRINDLSNMRSTLFNNLTNLYSTNQYRVAETRNDLVDELTTIKVIEGELNNSKSQLNALNKQKNNKLRMVEINTYFGKRYEAQTSIIKVIIITCIPILLITLLNKKNILTDNIANILIAVIIVVFIIIMWFKIGDLVFRDNMDFDRIKFPFNPDDVDIDSNGTGNIINLPDPTNLEIECIGEACCTDPSMVFDISSNACVIQSDGTTNTDTEQLTKEAFSTCDTCIPLKGGTNISAWRGGNVENYAKI
jgi:hypothetical protein